MYICNNCKEKISSGEQQDVGRAFPAFTVAGGILGTLGAALTGTILAVPAAIVAGAVADISSRRCEMCDTEIEDEEPSYHLMEELSDPVGGQSYRPVGKSAGFAQSGSQQPGSQRLQEGFQPLGRTTETSEPTLPDPIDKPGNQLEQSEFIYDETEGKLVQKDLPLTQDDEVNVSLGEGFDNNVDVGFEVPQTFELDDGTDFTNSDYFGEFQDDTSIDTEPFGPVDGPSVGGF